jgi:hypothetical protein
MFIGDEIDVNEKRPAVLVSLKSPMSLFDLAKAMVGP